MKKSWAISGFTGAGKSSALKYIKSLDQGQLVFQNYWDLDDYFTTQNGSPAEFIRKHGFSDFRVQERKALLELIANSKNSLIALGGGALTPENRESLKDSSFSILGIKGSFQNCISRIQNDNNRPILDLKPAERLKLFQEREKVWSKSDILIDNNKDLNSFYAMLKSWYSCQLAGISE